MSILDLDAVSVRYPGQPSLALKGASLRVERGDFVVLTGRSGCGKTTLLSVAAGLIEPTDGGATLDGRNIAGPGADRAMVFQDDALFPWLTVAENVAFALRLRGIARDERVRRAVAVLDRVGLANAAHKRIWELSGGQRQRVGLARALAAEPNFLLMDEPLGALDALTRERMQGLLIDIWASSGAGILMVTHGIEEALILGTHVVVMAPGPGHIVNQFEFDFSQRVRDGEPIDLVKADPRFQAERARLSQAIFAGEIA
ncbi:MAG: ATP-binding cassette domain-containing protein [Mesorhizobium sp.]